MMNIILFLVFILFWGGGYLVESGYLKENTPTTPTKIICPPKILFYLCGAPKSSDKPNGAMHFGVFRAQIMGISLGIYGLAISFWTPLNLSVFLLSINAAFIIPLVIAYFVDIKKT